MSVTTRRLSRHIHAIMILSGIVWGASASPMLGLAVLCSLTLLALAPLNHPAR